MQLKRPITKRLMLSIAQSTFDPVGFTCPVSLFPKLLLQKLWEKHACKKAYAPVVFLRVVRNDIVSIFLVAAKSHVAPLKKISILRLELFATTIGVRLYQSVKRQFSQYLC
ncbi:uncharacterized protein [Diabrotica undecimpunctata]|uniref:uncharacterized protein n=1 Tax=Diabrotica undecimpunctata TaxID=50387 RepID=UPI003B638563